MDLTDQVYGFPSSHVGSCGPFFLRSDPHTVSMALLLCEAHACAHKVGDTLSDLPAVRRWQLSLFHDFAELKLPCDGAN